MKVLIVLFPLVITLHNFNVSAQSTPSSGSLVNQPKQHVYLVVTNDGTTYVGNWTNYGKDQIIISNSKTGQSDTLKILQLKKVKLLRKHISGISHYSDYSRYILNSPAIQIPKGDLSFSQQNFFYSSLNYGITDEFSIESGISLPFLFGGELVLFITPKLKIYEKDNFSWGASFSFSALVASPFENPFSISILSTFATLGTPKKNLTFGIGQGFTRGQRINRPLIQFSGVTYVTDLTSLVFEAQSFGLESFIGNEGDRYYSLVTAVRIRRRHHTFDLGVYGFLEDDQSFFSPFFVLVPHVGYNVDLNRKNK